MLVVGTGAVASFLIPKLHGAGRELQVFGAPSLRLGALRAYAAVVSDPRAVQAHEGWLVVCKSWQNAGKVELLQSAPRPATILVLQNGLQPEADWSLPGVSVERGLSTYGLASTAPGRSVGGQRGHIVLRAGSPWEGILRRAGLVVRPTEDMQAAVWSKLLVNASLNVVASLYNLRNGEVLDRRPARRLAAQAAREVAMLARLEGVDPGPEDPAQVMERVALDTAGNVCSTLADLRSGRPTEYDSINGAILARAARHRLELPVLRQLDRRFSAYARESLAGRRISS